MENPKVSIIIPCYNSEDFVEESITSALEQSYGNAEVIVVNDGSTDSSEEKIKKFENNVTWITTENKGACHARNTGLKLSSGERINFLDSDDVLYKDCIKEKVLFECAYDVIPICDSESIGEGVISEKWQRNEYDLSFALAYRTPSTPSPLHYKADLIQVGGFDETLPCAQEYDLHLRLMALLGRRFVSNSNLGVGIRQRKSSLSRSAGVKMQVTIESVLKKIRSSCFSDGDYDQEIGHHLVRLSQHAYRAGEFSVSLELYEAGMDVLNYKLDGSYYEGVEKFLINILGVRNFEFIRFLGASAKKKYLWVKF